MPKQSERSFQGGVGGFFWGSGEQKQNHNRNWPRTPHRKAWARTEPTAIPISEQAAVLQSEAPGGRCFKRQISEWLRLKNNDKSHVFHAAEVGKNPRKLLSLSSFFLVASPAAQLLCRAIHSFPPPAFWEVTALNYFGMKIHTTWFPDMLLPPQGISLTEDTMNHLMLVSSWWLEYTAIAVGQSRKFNKAGMSSKMPCYDCFLEHFALFSFKRLVREQASSFCGLSQSWIKHFFLVSHLQND